ncbi:hypothetical protein D1872_231100 [compost metagenome]
MIREYDDLPFGELGNADIRTLGGLELRKKRVRRVIDHLHEHGAVVQAVEFDGFNALHHVVHEFLFGDAVNVQYRHLCFRQFSHV